jgi:hypothetical protein
MLRAEQCARASSTAGSIFSQGCISPLPAYELSEMTCRDSLPRSTEAVLWSSELTRCVNTTAVLHGLAESMGLRGYYPSDRRITSCPKTRLYLIILLFLLHQQFYRDFSVYAISQLTWQTVLAHFFNVRLCTRLKSLAAFLHTVLRVLARPVLHEPYLVQQAR